MSGRQIGPNKEMYQPSALTMESFGSSICVDTAQYEMRVLLLCGYDSDCAQANYAVILKVCFLAVCRAATGYASL
jgi:hypothetical protein